MEDNRRKFLKQLAGLSSLAGLSGVSSRSSAAASAQVEVTGIRLAKNKGYLRLVFDLDKTVQHTIFSLHNPERVVLDLKRASMSRGLVDMVQANNLIRGIRSGVQNGKDLRVVFDLKEQVAPRSFQLNPSGSAGHRLVLDLHDAGQDVVSRATHSTKSVSNKKLRDVVIAIDAGHGGKDPGAVGYKKYREKIVVYQIARELKNILKARGYKVYMTRDKDKFVKLSNRTKFANKKDADIFISIHANAIGRKNAKKVHGVECYFLNRSRSARAKRVAAKENSADLSDMDFYGKESFLNTVNSHNIVAANKLAIDLQRGMLGSLNKRYKNVRDGGVREGPFWVLVGAQMPSVLVEVGFLTHPTEAKRLVNRKYQNHLAKGLANGVERYFLNN